MVLTSLVVSITNEFKYLKPYANIVYQFPPVLTLERDTGCPRKLYYLYHVESFLQEYQMGGVTSI